MVMSSYGGKQDGGGGGLEGEKERGSWGCGDEFAKGGGKGCKNLLMGKCVLPSALAAASTAYGAE